MFPVSDDFIPTDATRGLRVATGPPCEAPLPGAQRASDVVLRQLRRKLAAGDDLAGECLWNYQLLARIGAGGMGVVYQARHRLLGRTVAVKFLTLELLDNPEGLERFRHEALAIGALDHPNIVRAMDAGALEGIHFLVTEFVAGQDLSKLARPGQGVAPAEACEIIRQAALGLDHAHARGLVHRDIKPSNLLVNGEGVVKLLDFGLARLSTADTTLTTTGQLIGTLDYLAPEQAADSRSVDIRGDIYSLGCTLYFLLTGRPPFAGVNYESPASKIRAHLADRPRPVAEGSRRVPLAVCDVLERMMAKNPADRYQTPAQVAAALTPLARGAQLAQLVERSAVPGQWRPANRSIAARALDGLRLVARRLFGHRATERMARPVVIPAQRVRKPLFSVSGVLTLAVLTYLVSGFCCAPTGRSRHAVKVANPFASGPESSAPVGASPRSTR